MLLYFYIALILIIFFLFSFFFFNDTATTEIYTLSLHDALPIYLWYPAAVVRPTYCLVATPTRSRSEEHTSELQSQSNLVCRLLLEKKKTKLIHHRLFTSLM